MFTRRRFGALALGCLLLVGAACGDDAGTADTGDVEADATTVAPTTTVALPIGRITVTTVVEGDKVVTKGGIVSLSPSATEMLFAMGAGDQVVAVDSFSNYPLEAPITDLSAYEPNVEAIAAYEPSLVVTDGTNQQLIDQLNALGIATFAAPAPKTLNGAFEQMERLGAVTGNIAGAAAVVAELEARTKAILDAFPDQPGQLTYYYELDNTYYSASSKTFIGSVLGLLDMVNIADEVDNKKSAGYPQLTPEFIVEKDPDVIFLADSKCCQVTPESVAARPGWSAIRAVQEGHIIVLDDDIASRWGPRIVDLLAQAADAVRAIVPRVDDGSTDG